MLRRTPGLVRKYTSSNRPSHRLPPGKREVHTHLELRYASDNLTRQQDPPRQARTHSSCALQARASSRCGVHTATRDSLVQGDGNLALGDAPRTVRGIRHRLEEKPEPRAVLAKELLLAAQGLAEVPVGGGLAWEAGRAERVRCHGHEFKTSPHMAGLLRLQPAAPPSVCFAWALISVQQP